MLEDMKIWWANRRSARTEQGASAVEYGLLIAGVAALIVTVVFALGQNAVGLYDTCDRMIAQGVQGDCR